MSSRRSTITAFTFLSRIAFTLNGSGQDIDMRHEMKLNFAPAWNFLATSTSAQKGVDR